ncbi:serine/threonine protein kinase, partial [bacterium]|nr:serine/threonine protein kinase [bacterium]
MSNNSENTLQIGTVINNKWVILEFIAKGGMGEVYRAHQLNLKRDVAIKIISREWLESLEDNEEEMEIGLQRFQNEVQAMAQVRHSNVLQIYDYGSFSIKKDEEDLSMEYIAMEYVPGGTLWSTMSEDGFYPEKDLTVDWLLNYFLPVLEGIDTLHEANIIHRDLKPGNVLMDGKTPKIADFGLARSSRMRPVTKSIDVKGTPAYMSPEHFMDLRRTDQRSDIYSLGKILFEAIDGKMSSEILPFKCASLPHPENPFFKKLDQIIQKATAEDRNSRFDSVDEFRDAILEAIGTETLKKPQEVSTRTGHIAFLYHPKWIWSGIAVAIISLMLMTLWHLLGEPGKSILKPQGPPVTTHEMAQPKPLISSEVSLSPPVSPESRLIGKDEATLHLIPGGELVLPENFAPKAGQSVQVDYFYMDETE